MRLEAQIISAPLHQRMLQGRRVLVVEDNAMISILMEDELIDAGAEVVGPANSVQEALGLIDGAAADGGLSAAVLDIDVDGKMVSPVADRLVALGIPFVVATGYPEWWHRGLLATTPTLEKPFEGGTLAVAVRDLTTGR